MLSLRHYLRPYKTIRFLLTLVDLLQQQIKLRQQLSGMETTLSKSRDARIMALESIVECQKMELQHREDVKLPSPSPYLN